MTSTRYVGILHSPFSILHYLFFFFLFNPVLTDESKVEWLVPVEHDFGDLKQDEPVTFDFRFRNTSDGPIIIETVRTSCGCTASDWTAEAVSPGGESAVTIEFDAIKKGYFRKKITVFFSGQRKGEKLFITGFVE